MVAVGFEIVHEKNAVPAKFCVVVKNICVKHLERKNVEERKVVQLFKNLHAKREFSSMCNHWVLKNSPENGATLRR